MYSRVNNHLFRPFSPHVSGKLLERSFDRVAALDFTVNKYGHIRSQFSVLMESNDSLEQARVLNAMQELTSNEPNNEGRSFRDLVREIKPRWCDTPAELDRFEQYCIENALEFYKTFESAEPPKSEISPSSESSIE